jgi:uncharacterized protein YigE (DUF2233 family)
MRYGFRSAVLVLAMLAGCAPSQDEAANREAQGCVAREFEGVGFQVCAYDPAKHELRLATAGADGVNLRTFHALETHLGADAARVRFAMNAGMFDAQGSAIGLSIENSREIHRVSTTDGPGNFHMKPNGVMSVDRAGALKIEATEDWIRRGGSAVWATQSGPMLVIAGALHPGFDYDGDSLNIRNGVGVRDDGIAFFVISDRPVSFGKIARLLRDDLDCPNALYFDGFVSSLWSPAQNRLDDRSPLGPMVVVLNKPAAS